MVKQDPSLAGIKIGDYEFKINHFADDTFGILKNLAQLPEFNKILKIFFEATNMKENPAKREYLAIGITANLPTKKLPGAKYDKVTKKKKQKILARKKCA